MSKDIWHSALEIPVFDDTVVFIDDLNNWHTGYTQRDNDGITDHDSGEIYTEENVLRWAYIKDLLALETELDRTRKTLDVATGFIKGISQTVINDCDNQYVVLGNFKKFAQDTLNQIKTITEQKDNK